MDQCNRERTQKLACMWIRRWVGIHLTCDKGCNTNQWGMTDDLVEGFVEISSRMSRHKEPVHKSNTNVQQALKKCSTATTAAAAAAKLLQSCPTLCDPTDGSPPGSAIPGILQARTLGWVAISFSRHESEKWKWSHWVVSNSQRPHGLQPTRLLHPWDFPGKSTGVGCHCLHLPIITEIRPKQPDTTW